MIQLNKRKQNHADHHAKRADIIRKRSRYEAIILCVFQWSHAHLSGRVKIGVAETFIIDIKLEYTVHVRQLESGL